MLTLKILSLIVLLCGNAADQISICEKCNCNETNIDCSNQNLDTFPSISENITHVVLSNNSIENIQAKHFVGSTHIEHLDLSHNLIETIADFSFANTHRLMFLNLAHNYVKHLPMNKLMGLSNLDSLYLDHNKLQQIDPETFRDLKNLKFLRLQKNQLIRLPVATLTPLHKLRRLKIDTQTLLCSCSGHTDSCNSTSTDSDALLDCSWKTTAVDNSSTVTVRLSETVTLHCEENDMSNVYHCKNVIVKRVTRKRRAVSMSEYQQRKSRQSMPSFEVDLGGEVILQCPSVSGKHIRQQWSFNGRPITSGMISVWK